MFDQLFERPHALARQLSAPLVEERRQYLSLCHAQEFSRSSLRLTAQLLVATAEYLKLDDRSSAIITLQEVEEAGSRWSQRVSLLPIENPRLSRQRFVHSATGWLAFLGRLEIPSTPGKPYDPLIADFAEFLRNERGLSTATIELRFFTVRAFLDRLGVGERSLDTISVADVDSALAQQVNEEHYARVTVQTCASSLRSFFRYAEMRQWCRTGIAAAIMAPRVFQHESLPSGPVWEYVRQALDAVVGGQPAAIRDRAILMLLTVYGVRAGEVARLKLDDIDWQGRLSSSRGPSCFEVIRFRYARMWESHHPLREGGEAKVGLPELFLTMRAPFRPLSSGTLWPVVARRLRPP